MMNARDRITRVRTQLIIKHPFFACLALKLKVKEFEEETMATDGVYLYYNESFVDALPTEELTGVICHELLHCAFLHMYRRNNREPRKWNHACDYAINWLMVEKLGMHLPKDALINKEFADMSAEEIYNRLPDMPEMPKWGGFSDGKSQEGRSLTEQEAEWVITTAQAANAAKNAGMNMGGLEELVKETQAQVNWREQLARLLNGMAKTDYNWYPPNLVYVQRKLHIPTLNAPSLGKLVFAIDTSGSVSQEELAQFIAELKSVMSNLSFESMTVIQCDTEVTKVDEYEDCDNIEAKVYGRGGTLFKPVFDHCQKIQADNLIYFTDMYPCDGWGEEPGYPVFWARTTNTDAPYGQHIDLWRG
jgi:predicted metal-dependent peptidase